MGTSLISVSYTHLRDVHGKILRIVNDIAGGEISVGGYVDTVLRQHLEQHKERINELYKKPVSYTHLNLDYTVAFLYFCIVQNRYDE